MRGRRVLSDRWMRVRVVVGAWSARNSWSCWPCCFFLNTQTFTSGVFRLSECERALGLHVHIHVYVHTCCRRTRPLLNVA